MKMFRATWVVTGARYQAMNHGVGPPRHRGLSRYKVQADGSKVHHIVDHIDATSWPTVIDRPADRVLHRASNRKHHQCGTPQRVIFPRPAKARDIACIRELRS